MPSTYKDIYELLDPVFGYPISHDTFQTGNELKANHIGQLFGIYNQLRPSMSPSTYYKHVQKLNLDSTYSEQMNVATEERQNLLRRQLLFEIPDLGKYEYRHLYTLDLGYKVSTELGETPWAFQQHFAIEPIIQKLKIALLYPHSIIIPEALFAILSQLDEINVFIKAFPKSENDPKIIAIVLQITSGLYGYLKFLGIIRPLVEARAVILIPSAEIDIDSYN